MTIIRSMITSSSNSSPLHVITKTAPVQTDAPH